MPDKLGDEARLQHMLDAIAQIQTYINNSDFEEFEANTMMQDACIRQLSIIGEASSRLSEELKAENPEMQWREIRGFRNIVVHQYFGVDTKVVWDIIEDELLTMRKKLGSILSDLQGKS